jgi:hypothetical protein
MQSALERFQPAINGGGLVPGGARPTAALRRVETPQEPQWPNYALLTVAGIITGSDSLDVARGRSALSVFMCKRDASRMRYLGESVERPTGSRLFEASSTLYLVGQ